MPQMLGWPFPEPTNSKFPTVWRIKSSMVVGAVGMFSKVLLEKLNSYTVHNKAQLVDSVSKREDRKPLITVSNHTSCIDDPLLWGCLPTSTFKHSVMRWVPAADEICFANLFTKKFFSLGQCVPVCRGEGVYQKAIDYCVDRLNVGEWVHMFVEGKVNLTHELMRFKWGVGRLIADSEVMPLVLPLWHIGLEDVLPNKKPYIPKIGKRVTLLVGEPVDFSELLNSLRDAKKSSMEIRKLLTDKLQEEMYKLRTQARALHFEQYGEHHD